MQVEELQASINLSTRRAATGTAVWNGWSDNKDPTSRSHKSTIFYDITACYQNYGLVGANYTIRQIWTTRLNNRFWSCLCGWIEYWCQDSAFVFHLFYVWPSIFWYVYYVFTIYSNIHCIFARQYRMHAQYCIILFIHDVCTQTHTYLYPMCWQHSWCFFP